MDNSLIEGVIITPLKAITDTRGAVLHFIRSDSPGFDVFGESYFSEINPGAVKAWKKHLKQIQNISVPMGVIQLALYDDRENSATFGKLEIHEIGRPNSYVRITIPINIWHGFKCVSNTPALLVNCANIKHEFSESIVLSHEDKTIPLNWDII
jgi:dTDP-4-dehydrorhamnose 3,5-epimerase